MSEKPRDETEGAAAGPPPAPGLPRPAVGAGRLSTAKPESTVTLMVQSGQAPGGLAPGRARPADTAATTPATGLFARWWAVLKSWF